jgi:hypothetical protein
VALAARLRQDLALSLSARELYHGVGFREVTRDAPLIKLAG